MINEEKLSEELLAAIEKIKGTLLKRIAGLNLSREDIIEIVGQLDFFEELKSLGYGTKLDDYFKNYEQVIVDITKQARASGVDVGASVKDLDNFINVKFDELLGRASQYGKELKTELLRHIIAGTTPNEIALALSEVPLTNNQLRVAVNSGISQFQRIGVAKVYESKPEQRFILDGVDDERNRPACDAVLKYQNQGGNVFRGGTSRGGGVGFEPSSAGKFGGVGAFSVSRDKTIAETYGDVISGVISSDAKILKLEKTFKQISEEELVRIKAQGYDAVDIGGSEKELIILNQSIIKQVPDKIGYTKKEIDEGAATKIVEDHAEEFAVNAKGEIIPSELKQALENEYSFADCGGFNCRHRWRAVRD